MLFTTPLVALLSVLPFLASATAEPELGLNIKKVDMARKRQATGGNYVSDYNQCTQVCVGYFGKPTTTIAGNNAVVSPTTRTTSTSIARSTSVSTVRPTTTSTRVSSSITPKPSTSTVATTRASSGVISSATSVKPTTSQPAATGSTSVGGATAAQQKLILDLHNAERKDYGANPLTWNSQLEKYALDYAKGCAWKHSGGPYGENLAASYGYPDAISQGINGWNNERSDYNPASPMYSHWTQVVWKGTSEVGCALVKCPAGSIQPGWGETQYLVCEYQKPGNYAGQYGTNVGTRVAA